MYSNALNGIDLEVLDHLSHALGEHYQENRSWDTFVQNRDLWKESADNSFFYVFFYLMDKAGDKKTAEPIAPDEFAKHATTNPEWDFPFGTFYQRLSLLDADKNTLIQADLVNQDASYRRITANGQLVGWVRVGKINVDILPLGQYFFDQQLKVVYGAAIFGGLVAVILSLFLARHIAAPIKSLSLAAHQLAQRNFKHTLHINTGDELEDLADSFNTISQELDQYQTRQQQWLMNISHELRAPLTLLVGEVYAVCDNLTRCDDKTAAFLQDQVMHVKRIADDLYQICQIEESGFQLDRQSIELREFVTYQVQRYAESFSKNRLRVSEEYPQEPIYVFVDCDRFGQVLSNLFDNCLRYTQTPGELWIRIGRDNQEVILELEDSGPGVPKHSLPKLFDRLYRAESAKNKPVGAGAGLGLAICKEIVTAHHGSIEAVIGTQGGLRILLRLPLLQEQPE